MIDVQMMQITHDAERVISNAARICYQSTAETDDDNNDLIKQLVQNGHHSPLEHATATFRITGISRACSHQLVRHRLASFNQKSQRYVEENKDVSIVIPPTILDDDEATEAIEAVTKMANRNYHRLIHMGIPKEDARYVLPAATETEMIVTMNFRELRHFFSVRMASPAQWEIKAVARAMFKTMRACAPSVFSDFDTPV